MNSAGNILRLLRVYQYSKNFFVFAPAFFAGRILEKEVAGPAFMAFLIFCVVSSLVYVMNDIIDCRADALHPVKKHRPLASSAVSLSTAYVLVIFLLILSGILLVFHKAMVVPIMSYVLLNVLYTFFLKKIPLVDVFALSIGFVLRVVAGGMSTGIEVSHWLFIMTYMVSLFLAFAKRRDDVLMLKTNPSGVRESSREYTLSFLDGVMAVLVAVLMVSYLLYTLSEDVIKRFEQKKVYPSGIFVMLALFRYIQKALVHEKSADPSREVFNDGIIFFCVMGWLGYFIYLIYF